MTLKNREPSPGKALRAISAKAPSPQGNGFVRYSANHSFFFAREVKTIRVHS